LVGEVDSSLRKFTDIKVDVFSHSYEYFVEGFDLCNQPMRTNVHTSILLNGMKIDGYDTKLKWSKYLGWKNGVQNYNVVRRVAEDAIYNGYEVTIDTNAYYQNGFDSWQQCYRIKASQSNGKYISFSNRICFTFDPILWIPDAFTPNDDRINDVFLLKGGSLKYYEITVYNRWGEKLFFSDDLNVSWDGTFHDKPCQSDAYVYIVKYWGFDNVRKLETGSFQLLR
jgi:gliding motility-associated-like protein